MNWVGKIQASFHYQFCTDFIGEVEIALIFIELTAYKVLTFAVKFGMFIVHTY